MNTWIHLLKSNVHELDLELQASVYQSFRQLVYRDIYFVIRDHTWTEDVIQEAFMKIVTNAHKMKHDANIQGWVKQVTRNTTIDFVRKHKKIRQISMSNNVNTIDSFIESLPSEANTADEVEFKERKELLIKAMNELKYDHRIVLALFYIEDKSYKEISRELGITEQMVAQRLMRARRKLLQHFGENGMIQMNEKQLKDDLKRIYDEIEIPEGLDSWQQVQAKLRKKIHRQKWLRRMKISAAIIFCSLAINFFMNDSIPATYSQFNTLVKKLHHSVIQVFHDEPNIKDHAGAKTPPPDESALSYEDRQFDYAQSEITALEDAMKKADFTVLVPSYVPKSYHLETVRMFPSSHEQYNNVYMEYVKDSGEFFKIIQQRVAGESASLKTEFHIDSGELQDIEIHGNPAILIVLMEGNVILEWMTKDNVKVYMSGSLAPEEIVKTAQSME